ncbi:MAG: AAA family ATPase [Desulfobacterales bacterium]|jgi:general secretion pathway protein A
MYCNFFGFEEKPFEMTADPKYLYLNKISGEILANLIYGVQNRRGIILIIGEVGTGKTTILNALRESIKDCAKVAFIFNTEISFKQMLKLVSEELGLQKTKKMTVAETLQCLNQFALEQSKAGGNVVLIIDEAQNLSYNELESMRLLSNIENRQNKLIQIVLCGQPKLGYKLTGPELEQLIQRISIKCYIKKLNEKDTYNYIDHRLNIAKYKGPKLFDKNALKLIWENSEGVPLKINMLCDNSLRISYATERTIIDDGVIREAVRHMAYNPFKWKKSNRKLNYFF